MTKRKEKGLTTGQMAPNLWEISNQIKDLALGHMNTKMAASLRFVLFPIFIYTSLIVSLI